jgi:hypothetical protein
MFQTLKASDLRVVPNQWFVFEDDNGIGYAEADLLVYIEKWKMVLLFECKRTHKDRGLVQLGQLYGPLLESALGAKVFSLLVAENLDPKTPRTYLCETLQIWLDKVEEAILRGVRLEIHSLNWRRGWT